MMASQRVINRKALIVIVFLPLLLRQFSKPMLQLVGLLEVHTLPAKTNIETPNMRPPTSIVIELSGEMANNLCKLAAGKSLQLWAKREYGIDTNLVLRKEYPDLVGALEKVKTCFPRFRSVDFMEGNGPVFDNRNEQQREMFGINQSSLFRVTTARVDDIENTLSTLSNVLRTNMNANNNNNNNRMITSHVEIENNTITLPFLYVSYLALIDVWVDNSYEDLQQFLAFNRSECCKLTADPDETVFHYRNYAVEMPRRFKELGFQELGPNETANELFRNLQAGDKLAMTSRFISHPSVQPYVDAFTARGIQVRLIQGQSGVEDFCFLLSAKKELVGIAESSFTSWAGYLGDAERVRLYSIDSPARRGNFSRFQHRVYSHFNWTNPKLTAKVFFELYQKDDG